MKITPPLGTTVCFSPSVSTAEYSYSERLCAWAAPSYGGSPSPAVPDFTSFAMAADARPIARQPVMAVCKLVPADFRMGFDFIFVVFGA